MNRKGLTARLDLMVKPDQLKRLKALSAETGAPVGELVRRAIEEYLKRKG